LQIKYCIDANSFSRLEEFECESYLWNSLIISNSLIMREDGLCMAKMLSVIQSELRPLKADPG